MVFMVTSSANCRPCHALIARWREPLESSSELTSFLFAFQNLAAIFLCIAGVLVLPESGLAQPVHEPAHSTQERKAILNAVRPLVEAHLGPPVEFVVSWMRSGGGWAFAGLEPQRPGGAKISLKNTVYSRQAEYMDGLHTYASLRYQYGRWNIIDYAIGPTDVFWQGDPLCS